MHILDAAALLVSLTALLAFINHRFIKLPANIGVMLLALLASILLVVLGKLGLRDLEQQAADILTSLDFNYTLMHGMLSFLLFAGALHVNLSDLAERKWIIGTLASVSVIASTFIVGGLAYLAFNWLQLEIPFIYCLLFGALISPTDPIAVLGILKKAGAPKSLETSITGESLFNDGVAVVVFMVLLEIAAGGHEMGAGDIATLFVSEAGGGAILGLATGALAYYMLKHVDNYQVEVLITLAVVMGGYSLATALHLSGPVAVVVAGLVIGNHGRTLAMSETTRHHLDTFWELLDEILNAVLFVLIGLETIVLVFETEYFYAAALAIPIVLLARLICVAVPVSLFRLRREFSRNAIKIMTWGGLRGGISVALALSLPTGDIRDSLVAITYVIVIFSIVVQGLTIGRLIRS
jgi:CPA1 family monovalent cation:H+ antiporter